ncbi:MAG: two-component regulator propeller domain-containing protein [Acidobacteriota bacterium]|nr:two-component regulator propeller domain-containing protein [Acidobacteriota bacterium]
MWFGTHDGLIRFDGFNFKVWKNTTDQPHVLAGDTVHCLYEDSQGTLWLGTSNGLSRYDRDSDSFTHFLPDLGTPGVHGEMTSITADAEGTLWIAVSRKGLLAFRPQARREPKDALFERFHKKSNEGRLKANWVHDLLVDKAGTLWIGTYMGLMKRAPGGLPQPHRLPETVAKADPQILAIHEDRNGFLWLGSENDLLRYDRMTASVRSHGVAFSGFNLTGPLYPNDIVEDSDGRIWTATYHNGLIVYDPKTSKAAHFLPDHTVPSTLGSKLLTSLTLDQTGLLWIGSEDRGIFRHNPETRRFGHSVVDHPEKSPKDLVVTAIHEEENGDLWLGGMDGVYHFGPDGWLRKHLVHDPKNPAQSIGYGRIGALLMDRRKNMWVATNGGGLSRVPSAGKGPVQTFTNNDNQPESLAHDGVSHLFEDPHQGLWVGTSGAGLDLYTDGRFTHFRAGKGPDRISDDMIHDLAGDREGRLWVATKNGLTYRENGIFSQMHHHPDDPLSLDANLILTLCQSRDGSLWAGTNRGLNRLRMADGGFSIVRYGEKDGLPGGIMNILEDWAGSLWISTTGGLVRFDPQQRISRIYDVHDGIQSDWFIHGAAFRSADGRLFFGGERGFNVFDPARIEDNTLMPPVFITGMKLFDEELDHNAPDAPLRRPVSRTDEVVLSYRDNFLVFEFAALDYATPERNRYAYKMTGLHEDWRFTSGAKNQVAYANMTPGDYVFHVKGSNRDGYWQEEARELRVSITPPLWATRWAYTVYFLLLVLLAAAYLQIQKNRLNRERRINENLDRMVSERTHDLKVRNEEIMQQQQQLRKMDQMKTRFFTNLSHEFRTPLTLMLGPVEDVLSQDGVTLEKMEKTLQTTRRHSLRLLQMINELLDVSKLEAGHMTLYARETDLAAFVALCAAPFQAMESKARHLKLKLPTRPVPVFFDPSKLEKVFSNLIMNAFKHIPKDGLIVISLAEAPNQVSVTVQDNGPGIPEDQLRHVFDRFYQAAGKGRKASQGTGIGLSLAREIILLHGGEIIADGEEGFGSTFTVTLRKGRDHLKPEQIVTGEDVPQPLHSAGHDLLPSEMLTPATKIESPVETKGRLRILVIEDHVEIQAYLQEILAGQYDVHLAGDGEKGLADTLEQIPDLLICDVMLPDMDGLEICRLVKRDTRTSHIPIIVLTARTSAAQNAAGLDAGADAYITKPFSSQVLLSQISNLIRNRRLLQERFAHKITAAASNVDVPSGEEAFLHKAVSCMEANLQAVDFGVNELATEMGLSRRQLHRKLTAITGKTPSEILRGIRLGRAAQLLQRNTDQVSQIAYMVGFSKTKHFSKLFREAYGQTPSEYTLSYRQKTLDTQGE